MQNILTYLFFLIGLLLLIKGADWLVRGSRFFTARFGISELVVGVTIVSVCTTLPETLISAGAAAVGETGLSLSTVLGTLAANIGLVCALTFLLYRPEIKEKRTIAFNCVILFILLLFLGVNFGVFHSVPRASGIVLLLLFCYFIYQNVKNAKKHHSPKTSPAASSQKSVNQKLLFFVLGIVATFTGSFLILHNSIRLATLWQLPVTVLGLSVTAIAAALPKFIVSIIAVHQKASSLSVGNLLGSCILDILLALGISSTIRELAVPTVFLSYHLPAFFLMISGVLLFTLYGDRRYTRLNGGILLFMYLTYLWIGTLTLAA